VGDEEQKLEKIVRCRVFFAIIFFVFSPLVLASVENTLTEESIEEGIRAENEGQWQKAISIYTNSLSKNQKNSSLWLRIASLEYKLKNYSLAINAYQHAVDLEPKNPFIHKRLSEIYSELNQPKEALLEINKAVELNPNSADYLISKAQIANWNLDAKTALASYQKALALERGTKTAFDPMELLLQIAQLQSQLNQHDKAIESYNELIRRKPSAKIYQALSQNYAAANEPQKALSAINAALLLEPDNMELLRSKAMLATWLNNGSLVMETYQRMLKLLPEGQKKQVLIDEIIASSEKTIKSIKIAQKAGITQEMVTVQQQLISSVNQTIKSQYYVQTAEDIKKEIRLNPKNAALYKKLSEFYATKKQPALALNAINQALLILPNNIDYLRARAKLASWAVDKLQMKDSYERILKLKPNDEDALLNLAFTYSWMGKTDKALALYRYLLKIYPNNTKGWMNYAEGLSWIGAFKRSLNALERYRILHGDLENYLKIKARILAAMGRFKSARAINEPLLQKKPHDPYLLTTQVGILNQGLQTNRAVLTLDKLHELHPDYFSLRGLDKLILTPLRSNINLGAAYTWASDTTRITQFPTLVGQYFLTPATSLLVQGLYERAIAAPGSGLNTIDDHNSIFDESMMVGLTTQIPSRLNLKGLAGGLKIQSKGEHFIYYALAATNLGERAVLTVENSYNLYRPYLIPQSPRLISLQIMENRIGGTLQWQPFIQKYLNVIVSYSDLSRGNSYFHANVWPKVRIHSSQKWQVNMGANLDSWNYADRAFGQGYYAPYHFQSYEGTLDAYYGISENIGFSVIGGFGMQKDETYPRLYYEEDLAAQLFLGIFTDWQLKLNAGYTLRMNPFGSYRSWTSGLTLVRRF
jgi:tetratricopeptide (TPR) repeat protein